MPEMKINNNPSDQLQLDNLHSEEANDIFGRLPSWIVRWGTTMLCGVFAGLLLGCWLIRYPQTVDGIVVITTLNPPADLVARTSGRIDSLFASEGCLVHKGDRIALLHSTANVSDVDSVRTHLAQSVFLPLTQAVTEEWLNVNYDLGEIQSSYEAYCQSCMAYRQYLQTDYIGRKKILLSQQIDKSRLYHRSLREQQRLSARDMQLETVNAHRDSLLYAEGILSQAEYETSVRTGLQTAQNKSAADASVTGSELEILQMEQQLIELDIQRENEIAEHERRLSQCRRELLTAIDQWLYQYVLEASTDGRLTYIGYWSSNLTVAAGDRLGSVTPLDSMQVIGRMYVPSVGLGKVKPGQVVNVKLRGYPYMEYGLLKGRIRSLSAVPDERQMYIAEMDFPDGLYTTYHKPLQLIQQMDGSGSIVTHDMRLIEQFVRPIRALFDKR